jgi:hypothetical protein
LQFPKQTGDVKGRISADIQLADNHTGRYNGDITITVTSLTATRIAGTFTADQLNNSPDTPDVKPRIADDGRHI